MPRPQGGLGQLSAIGDLDRLLGGAGARPVGLDLLDHIHALGDGAKHDMLAVQPGGGDGAQEELRTVRVGPSIGHRQDARASVLQLEVLIGKLGTVDGLATGAIARGEIAALTHEAWDHTVERGTLEVEGLAKAAGALLTWMNQLRTLDKIRAIAPSSNRPSKPSKPTPYRPHLPVHRARKFSAVFGTTSERSCRQVGKRSQSMTDLTNQVNW